MARSAISEASYDRDDDLHISVNPSSCPTSPHPEKVPGSFPSAEATAADSNESDESDEENAVEVKRKKDTWAAEILSLGASTILLGMLIYMLHRLDGRPLTIWTYSITPNACVSIVIALVEAGAAVALSSGIGQLKWIKYRQRPRSLAQMQFFDDASRKSFIGSCWIGIGRGGFVAACGLWLMVLTLVMNPFAQQVLKYPLRSVPSNGSASVLSARSYGEYSGSDAPDADVSLPMKAAIINALYGFSVEGTLKTPFSSCTTGNCTWEPFLSLGVCSECVDISNLLNGPPCKPLQSERCTWTLPPQYANLSLTIAGMDLNMMRSSVIPLPKDKTSGDLPSLPQSYQQPDPILNFIMINSTTTLNESESTAYAANCKLRFCMQSISAATSQGVFQQHVTQVLPELNLTLVPGDVPGNWFQLWEFVVSENDTYVVNSESWAVLNTYLQFFKGSGEALAGGELLGSNPFSSDQIEALYLSGDVTGLFESIATSMSTRVREASSDLGGPTTILGTSYSMVAHFSVGWKWLLLPTVSVALTWIFLLAVIYTSHRCGAKIWKSSILPLLFHGPSDEARADRHQYDTVDAMNEKAKEIAVQLLNVDGSNMLSQDLEHTAHLVAKAEQPNIFRRSSADLLANMVGSKKRLSTRSKK